MILGTSSHILFYLFIIVVAGIGLFFSLKIEGETGRFFWANRSSNSITIGLSFFLVFTFYSLIIVLPGYQSNAAAVPFAGAFTLAVVGPYLAGKNVHGTLAALFEKCSGACRVIVSLHGLIFLGFIQILLLITVSDFIIQQFYGASNFSFLVALIVVAGIYTIVGGLTAVMYTNSIIAACLAASFAFLIFNAVVPTVPLMFSFDGGMRYGGAVFSGNGTSEQNALLIAGGILVMLFWLQWLELGGLQRKMTARSMSRPSGAIIASLAALATVAGILATASGPADIIPAQRAGGLVNDIVGLTFIIGVMGLFAVTYQAAGAVTALRLFPFLQREKNVEEQVLVGRLTTVVLVLLTILLIPFAKSAGEAVLVWFIDYLALFTTPIAASFAVLAAARKHSSVGFIAGVAAGECYAAYLFATQQGMLSTFVFRSGSVYAAAVDIFVVSAAVGAAAVKAAEVFSGQRVTNSA